MPDSEHTESTDAGDAPSTDAATSLNPAKSAPEAVSPKKSKLSKTLPTARINLPKQFEIINGYASAYDKAGQRPVSNQDVGTIVGLAPATVGMMNAFLVDADLIQKMEGGNYVPSAAVIDCARMFQINPDRAWPKLAPLIESSWFGAEIVAKLRVRTLSENDAIEDLAELANAEKDHLPQLRVALDFMEKTGIILREGGQIKLIGQTQRAAAAGSGTEHTDREAKKTTDLDEGDTGLERHSLTLDPKSSRKIVILAPPTLTKRELERIQQWLSFQLIVTDSDMNQT